jgi:hypothetical protein
MNEKLKFNLSTFSERANQIKKKIRVDNVTINLPFLSFTLSKNGKEKKIAREIIIRLRDKRVLKSKECCGSCIESALQSLVNIRELLVDKQVEVDDIDSPLFFLIDVGLYGIKTFLTFTENYKPRENILEYYDALDKLRQHLFAVFTGINAIAELPTNFGFRYEAQAISEIPTICVRSEGK